MISDAIRLGLRKPNKSKFAPNADTGFTKFEVPQEVQMSTRMHLTKKEAKALIVVLQKFVETGGL